MLRIAAITLFAAGWIPVFLLRSERFSERRAHAAPDERRAMWNALLAVAVHVTLAELALHDVAGSPVPTSRLVIGMLVFLVGLAFWMLGRHTLVGYGRLLDPASQLGRGGLAGPGTPDGGLDARNAGVVVKVRGARLSVARHGDGLYSPA